MTSEQTQDRNESRNYYLLWGYRKCGTTTLARRMVACGLDMPAWEENNIWMASPDDVPGLLRQLWQDQPDAPYFVDLSTLTHLARVDHAEVLKGFGCVPRFIVCTRPAGPRWVSAWTHMKRKKAENRDLRSYLSFYEEFAGLCRADLRELEDELIHRDLRRGIKTHNGVIDPAYFSASYPIGFTADPQDPFYQFRYFGETLDMLEKRPANYVELPLDDIEATTSWLENEFGVASIDAVDQALNRDSAFNAIRHHPAVTRFTRHIPRTVRRRVASSIETSRLLPRVGSGTADHGLKNAMDQLVSEMIGTPEPERSAEPT